MNIIILVKKYLRELLYVRKQRSMLINKDFSLISSNCIGGVVLHDLRCRFNSPFVNLWIKPREYLLLLSNLKYYMNCELCFVDTKDVDYPVGLIGGTIHIFFMHYKTKQDALKSWEIRKKRINYNNLYVLFTDRDGCTIEDIRHFESLKYKKICFTHLKYKNFKSCFYVPGFEKEGQVGNLIEFKKHSIKRYFDCFNFAKWFNDLEG